jgi:hypothetical protein
MFFTQRAASAANNPSAGTPSSSRRFSAACSSSGNSCGWLDQFAHALDRLASKRAPSLRSAICAATRVSPRRASV